MTGPFLIRRAGLRWSATSMPVTLLLLLGLGFGPRGVNLLSPAVLEFLDPAMPVALAAFGALIGLAVRPPGRGDGRSMIVAIAELVLTVLAVSIGAGAGIEVMTSSMGVPAWAFGVLAGICAAASLGVPTGNPSAPDMRGGRIAEFDAALLIVAGALLLPFARVESLAAASGLGQSCAVALVLAGAGRLLLTHESSDTEQRVITLATLMLVGGVSAYLSLSPLLGGLAAGVLWQVAGGSAREWLRRDAQYVLHPLLVTLLLVMGARVELTAVAVGLGAAYALLRHAGQLGGGWLERRVAHAGTSTYGRRLRGPGILGPAIALSALRVTDPEAWPLISVIAFGTMGADLLAGFSDPREVEE